MAIELLRRQGMLLRLARAVCICGTACALLATASSAQTPDEPAPSPAHVRGATEDSAALLHELLARSASARAIVDHLQKTDVIVYIRHEWFAASTLRGRIGLSAGTGRLLVIEVASRYSRVEQMTALGHELQHAVEIADAPWVHDARSLAQLYHRIGDLIGRMGGSETYETAAAAQMGHRVRQELAGAAAAVDAGDEARN